MLRVEWFRIQSGAMAGQVHLSAWYLTAVASGPGSRNPYYGLASCPLCGALVPNDGDSGTYSREVALHEQWHARNDFPIPAELQDGGSR